MRLVLTVKDAEVVAALSRRVPGPDQTEFALAALRIGVLAIERASGVLDASTIQQEAQRMIAEVDKLVTGNGNELRSKMTESLREYFDPSSGKLAERLDRLVRKDGEISTVLASHLDGESSKLAQTLRQSLGAHVGENSPLLKLLSPNEKQGLLGRISDCVLQSLNDQKEHVRKQFSLDDTASPLSRLVAMLSDSNGKLRREFAEDIDRVKKEFSLDNPDGALSRLVSRVELAQKDISREFDANNEQSALNRLTGALSRTNLTIEQNLTLDRPESPLARLGKTLRESIDDLVKKQSDFQAEVREKLGIEAGKAAEALRGTAHGVEFEDLAGACLEREVHKLNDLFEATGRTTGIITRSKVGDHVIELGRESHAPGQRIVVECKEEADYSLSKALKELEQAKVNRSATGGIFVFSASSSPPSLPQLSRHGDDVVVVWDKEDPTTDVRIFAAYSIARALLIRRTVNDESVAAEWSDIEKSIAGIGKLLDRAGEIKTWAKTVRNNGENIEKAADLIHRTIEENVRSLREHVERLRTAAPGGVVVDSPAQ